MVLKQILSFIDNIYLIKYFKIKNCFLNRILNMKVKNSNYDYNTIIKKQQYKINFDSNTNFIICISKFNDYICLGDVLGKLIILKETCNEIKLIEEKYSHIDAINKIEIMSDKYFITTSSDLLVIWRLNNKLNSKINENIICDRKIKYSGITDVLNMFLNHIHFIIFSTNKGVIEVYKFNVELDDFNNIKISKKHNKSITQIKKIKSDTFCSASKDSNLMIWKILSNYNEILRCQLVLLNNFISKEILSISDDFFSIIYKNQCFVEVFKSKNYDNIETSEFFKYQKIKENSNLIDNLYCVNKTSFCTFSYDYNFIIWSFLSDEEKFIKFFSLNLNDDQFINTKIFDNINVVSLLNKKIFLIKVFDNVVMVKNDRFEILSDLEVYYFDLFESLYYCYENNFYCLRFKENNKCI